MGIVLFVVGDEILSGKRQDRHIPKLIELLAARGLELREVRLLGDDQTQIADAVTQVVARGDVLLSCGGIGATPDDRTRQAVAQALSRPIVRHPQAEALIIERFGEQAFPNRVLMADFPAGAELIPNPINQVAGFSVGSVYCVPGFPEMAWPMLEWVLDGPLRALHRSDPPQEYRLIAYGGGGEGDLLQLMQAVLEQHPGVALSSLPHRGSDERPRHIEFGIKGPAAIAAPAYRWFEMRLRERAELIIEPLAPPPAED